MLFVPHSLFFLYRRLKYHIYSELIIDGLLLLYIYDSILTYTNDIKQMKISIINNVSFPIYVIDDI